MLLDPREPFPPGEYGDVLSRFIQTGGIEAPDVAGAVHQNLHVLAHPSKSQPFKVCASYG